MAKSKEMCRGCRDDYYNQGNNSPTGECWMYKTAKIVSRVAVGTWQPPPYARTPQKVLSCFHCQGTHFLELTDCRIAKGKAKV